MAARFPVNDERLDERASDLRVSYLGGGVFRVASGSRPGVSHAVDADPTGSGAMAAVDEWLCGCDWGLKASYADGGRMCSHVRAAAQLTELALGLQGLASFATAAKGGALRRRGPSRVERAA
jgi:hypothetical protein